MGVVRHVGSCSCWCAQVQKVFADARTTGLRGHFEEGLKKMLVVHKMEPWNTRIIVDLAEFCIPLKRYDEAVSCSFSALQ